MRAIIVDQPGGPEAMTWKETPTPKPQPGEMLVKTVAAGVNRADLLQRRGYYPPPTGVVDIIGLEASGVIAELGDGVTGWQVGDEVVALLAGGGYAEYFTCPAGQLIHPPAGFELVDAAALIEVAATVVSNMDHINLKPQDTFLVHGGTGGIGSFAIQYAKQLGCQVITTAGTPEKLELTKQLGADFAFDYHGDWVADVKEATNGKGVDVILDIMGAKYLDANTKSLAMDGRMVVIGLQGGTKGELNLNRLLAKRATITATGLRYRPVEQKTKICRRVEEVAWPLLETGKIKIPRITRIPITEAGKAHELLDSGQNIGKIVLTLNQED